MKNFEAANEAMFTPEYRKGYYDGAESLRHIFVVIEEIPNWDDPYYKDHVVKGIYSSYDIAKDSCHESGRIEEWVVDGSFVVDTTYK